jgi:hypothetical protein
MSADDVTNIRRAFLKRVQSDNAFSENNLQRGYRLKNEADEIIDRANTTDEPTPEVKCVGFTDE